LQAYRSAEQISSRANSFRNQQSDETGANFDRTSNTSALLVLPDGERRLLQKGEPLQMGARHLGSHTSLLPASDHVAYRVARIIYIVSHPIVNEIKN